MMIYLFIFRTNMDLLKATSCPPVSNPHTVAGGGSHFSNQMFGSSSRLFVLFNCPLSLFHHRPSTLLCLTHRHSLTCPLSPLSAVPHHLLAPSRANSPFLIKSSQQRHSQSTSNILQKNNHVPADAYLVPPSHPWPEWSDLLESISVAGYFDVNRNIKDEFVPNESLSMEFVDAASSCLGFAHDRPDILGWLPKDDIQLLVDDGAPFLFKSALETERRMRSFLQAEESNEATTVDLMKYILSYASNPIIYPERNIREATESSARNLLREMANFSSRGAALSMPAMEKFNGAGEDEQTPRNLGPNITMKRGDWICPKCSFMNFAKNTKCLECEELRPQRQLTGSEWDCPQCNFFNYGRNVVCLKCECRRPGEVPLPTSLGQVKTPPTDRQLINSQYQNNFNDNHTPNGSDDIRGPNKNPETSFNCNLDQFHSNTSTVPGTYAKSTSRGQDAKKDGRFPIPNGSNSSYAPFVPLPADMFTKRSENMTTDDSKEAVTRSSDPKATVSVSNSEKSATKVESRIKDAAEEEKSERWFEKVAELHDVTDLASAISDEDFPQIMPMRKGENRFVVSKKKDRSLTSPTYKRQQALEQGSNSNFVPFVPFPPDYFAKKNDTQQSKSTTSIVRPTDETPSSHMSRENSSRGAHDMNLVQETQNQRTSSTGSLNSRSSVEDGDASSSNTTANSSSNQINRSATRPKTSYGSQQTPDNQNIRNGWEGKSLEGSAVKETDPLDMSEEAKAERWFRRVAQIKDISELSQIPDEDFPSIMPMRKGVNRFVVSKRKTPLERRLTSPQYRKNLQTLSSDPTKKEGDGS